MNATGIVTRTVMEETTGGITVMTIDLDIMTLTIQSYSATGIGIKPNWF